MGQYITLDDVRPRLIGKVQFTTDPDDDNKMQEDLAEELIVEAEGDVEVDLSPRYRAPFQTDGGGAFSELPASPTQAAIKQLCKLKAAIRILETDFGSGSAVEGNKYKAGIEARYKEKVEQLLKKKMDGANPGQGYFYPPLPSLRLNYMNEKADDGYMGSVLVTGQGDGGYPAKQINDPSENFWNGIIDD